MKSHQPGDKTYMRMKATDTNMDEEMSLNLRQRTTDKKGMLGVLASAACILRKECWESGHSLPQGTVPQLVIHHIQISSIIRPEKKKSRV